MRRIDAIGITLLVFLAGGALYAGLNVAGLEGQTAGIWAEAVLVVGLVGWAASYVLRVVTGKMTYQQQRQDYEDALLQQKLDQMSPEELTQLYAALGQEVAEEDD
jgi:ABC-type hemin transport system ATPase subunit